MNWKENLKGGKMLSFSNCSVTIYIEGYEKEKDACICASDTTDHVCTCKSQDKNEAVIFVEDLYKGEDPYKDIGKQDL